VSYQSVVRFALALGVVALAGCGARTSLDVPEPVVSDAGHDAFVVAPVDAAQTDAWSCVSIEASFRVTTPTMVFVIDRSGSMNANYILPRGPYAGATRWGAVLEVLVGEGGILRGIEDRVRLGAITFTSFGEECPQLHSVDPALHNEGAIAALLHGEGPLGGTPIAETMSAISDRIDALTIDGSPPTFVLMTDGEPAGCDGGTLDSAEAVASCFSRGARTYVIGLGDDVGEPYLQAMANAGAGVAPGDPDAEFWPAVQATRFLTAIDAISQRIADCRATLSQAIDPRRACDAVVRLGGRVLACDDPNGWAALDAHTIELRGTACTALVRDGTDSVTLEAPCDIRP
jgi:hypothetical protein